MKKLNKILIYNFINSEKTCGIILILCSIFSISVANSPFGKYYINLWHANIFAKSVEFWINDALMAIFFLLIGLEIKREIYIGELSNLKKALLPVFAAIGGMVAPALIHFIFNYNTQFQIGFGIPMATDIAFSLGVLSLLENKIPRSLKIFLISLAIIDDLGAIIVITLFYSKQILITHLFFACIMLAIMIALKKFKNIPLALYLILGCIMGVFIYNSGIHPTIAGVILAFVIPFNYESNKCMSYNLQYSLHKPVSFLIVPLFALANTAIILDFSKFNVFLNSNTYGIILGLTLGKPLGIFIFSILGCLIGACSLPKGIKSGHLIGVGLIAGIGFTMSIFITILAFNNPEYIINSKIAVLVASIISGGLGFLFLRLYSNKVYKTNL